MCTYRCVECDSTYVVDKAASVSNSHGLCPKCLRLALLKTFRAQQRKERLHDCAGRAQESCSQTHCTYHPICVNVIPTWADFQDVENRLMARTIAKNGRTLIHPHCETVAVAAAG